MLTLSQENFLIKCAASAKSSGHIFPKVAACEAALESAWGTSGLSAYNNLFGMKQHECPIYGTVQLPTKEFEHGVWLKEEAKWVSYPDYETCFKDRMETLKRMADAHPDYALALISDSPEEFVREVSKTWSTDPDRAEKVISIYKAHQNLLGE